VLQKKRTNHMRAKTGSAGIRKFTALLIMSASSATMFGQQQPVVNRPSTSSVQVTPRQAPSPYGNAPNPAVRLQRAEGTITGYVYWQMNVLQPSSSCQGLTLKVITVNKVGMPLQLLSTTSALTAAGPVTDTSTSATPTYMLCSYAFQSMPENVALRVLLYGAPSSASVSLPPSFQIPGGNCNSTPSGTLSFILTGGEMICGNGAFNINFKLNSTAGRVQQAPATATLLQSKPTPSGGMLSNSNSTALLGRAATPGTLTPTTMLPPQGSQPQSARVNTQSGVAPVGGQLLASKQAMNGGLSGGIKTGVPSTSPSQIANPPAAGFTGSGNFVPTMPPMSSNAKRDAAPPADAATKAQIQSRLRAQLGAANQLIHGSARVQPGVAVTSAPEIQALQNQTTFVNSLRTQGALTGRTLLATKLPNQNVRMQPPGSSNPMLHAPMPSKLCAGPQIHAVNGKTSGVVFTQDPKYNDYIITGCGFGTQQGQVYLSGAVTGGSINMAVKPGSWSDTQIEVYVQPGLTGVLDGWPDLIVAPVGTTQAKFPKCRFYAQRQSVPLPYIPQQYVTLANIPVGDSTHGMGTKYCPGPDLTHLFPCIAFNAGYKLDGITNGVDYRNDPTNFLVSNAVDRDGGQLDFNSGEDVYDLSYMAPGFVVDHFTVFWYAWTHDVCEGWASDVHPKKPGDSVGYYTEGYYRQIQKTPTKLLVDWGVDHCAWRWLGVFRVDDWYNSGYSLQIYVIGPIGIDPWTGHPVTTARNFGQAQPSRVATGTLAH
jgi:hypothetical protein